MDGQIYLWPLRPERNDVLPAPTRQRVNIIGPPCQGVTLFAGIVVALVDADNAGHAAAAMVEHGLGDLKPDAKFLEAAGNGAANIVQRPVGHTARRVEAFLHPAKAGDGFAPDGEGAVGLDQPW